jgi:hypothetical protein
MGNEDIERAGDGMPDLGEIDILETEAAGSGAGVGLTAFDVDVKADFAAPSKEDEFAMDVLTSGAAEVAEDGTIVADVVTASYDEESGITIIEEVLGVVAPDGTEIVEETVGVIDADGNYVELSGSVDAIESTE